MKVWQVDASLFLKTFMEIKVTDYSFLRQFRRASRVQFCFVKYIHGISFSQLLKKHPIDFITLFTVTFLKKTDFLGKILAFSRCNFVSLLNYIHVLMKFEKRSHVVCLRITFRWKILIKTSC